MNTYIVVQNYADAMGWHTTYWPVDSKGNLKTNKKGVILKFAIKDSEPCDKNRIKLPDTWNYTLLMVA